MLSDEKLRILTFPQSIAGNVLDLRILLIPTQRLLYVQDDFPSQARPGTLISLPKFINARPTFNITTIRGLVGYPYEDLSTFKDTAADTQAAGIGFPAGLPALYEGLAEQFAPTPAAPAEGAGAPLGVGGGIHKYLPRSYRQAFNFTRVRTDYASTDDSYHCAIQRSPKPDPAFKQTERSLTWGNVIAFCLRQPLLAERMGLIHRVRVPLPGADYFKDGGWVYASLSSSPPEFDIVDAAKELKRYAARIPSITSDRPLFAAVLFPVAAKPPQPNGDFDTLKIEAADYDDGFAKIVHAVQPVSANLLAEDPDGIHVQKDMGVRLGWDDEQILIWQNRQMLADPALLGKRLDAPLGVFSYRVDVRKKGAPDWESLVCVRNKAALSLAGQTIAAAGVVAENGVQVFPVRINADPATQLWLPGYFSQWYGASLALPDGRAAELDASGGLADPGSYADKRIPAKPGQKGGLYEPVPPQHTELKYGDEYDFRVRLADLAGGGPEIEREPLNDAPATHASLRFRRYVAPKQLTVKPLAAQPNPDSAATRFFDGNDFEISRPRLGYPALLFTELDTDVAFQKLLDDRDFLHTGKVGKETIKEPRAVGWFDPDVDRMLVIVDVRTLALDTLASRDGRDAFIPLYTTFRDFDDDPEAPFTLELEYRDANVIDFEDPADHGDLGLSQADIDAGGPLVLPTSRDIRITLFPACSDKVGKPAYFGFGPTVHAGESIRTGEPTQFFVRRDALDESDFFRKDVESRQLQGLYLQPKTRQVRNPATFIAQTVEGRQGEHSTLMQRLASQLGVASNGMTLIGRPGERIHFGCSHRIRHTLAPDHSSLTFAAEGDLVNHWLIAVSFEIDRDWTWDGLAPEGIAIERTKQFTGEPATVEVSVVGQLQPIRTASRVATTRPDRSFTRVVFIDAIEPKKGESATQDFPNTIDASYALTPAFVAAVDPDAADRERQVRTLRLPVTTVPAQVPKVVAAGYALSAYGHDDKYSSTSVRERFLWLELDRPVQDPNDACFARVLGYAPDPLLSFASADPLSVTQEDPPLAIDPELIRVITHDHGNDGAGLDAMQEMRADDSKPLAPMVKASPVHYLLPLPPGLHAESPELFGFFVYELRVGHTNAIWSTAQGRFGHPMRLSGVQHPAPSLKCLVDRTADRLSVTAPHAVAVFGGRNVTSKPPKTELWAMLYAQVRQADGKGNRNLLLAETRLELVQQHVPEIREFLSRRELMAPRVANSVAVNLDAPATGTAHWTEDQLDALLKQFDLSSATGLSVLVVEMMPRYDRFIVAGPAPDTSVRPLSQQLGRYRILRSSPLVAAPAVCCETC
jgi:hypothetical protein